MTVRCIHLFVQLPLIVSAVLVGVATGTIAQDGSVSRRALAVDVVRLGDQIKIHGILMDDSDQPSMLVERRWLRDTYPKIYESAILVEQESGTANQARLLQRLDQWMAARAGEERLVDFLTEERRRISELDQEDVRDRLFIRLLMNRSEIRHTFRQPPDDRKIAGLAWEHDLENVSTTSAKVLARQLVDKGVDIESSQLDLSTEIPAVADSEDRWAARKALIEFRYLDGLEFQGTSDQLFRLGDSPDLTQLLAGMLAPKNDLQHLGAALGLPEFKKPSSPVIEKDWWKKATNVADQEKANGVLISRILPISSDRVVVELSFYAKLPGDRWTRVVSFAGSSRLDQQDVNDLTRIEQDPQVQQVLQTMALAGFDVEDSRLRTALRTGAATEAALRQAQSEFGEFSLRSTRHVDSPIIFK